MAAMEENQPNLLTNSAIAQNRTVAVSRPITQGRGRGIINPKNLGYGVPLAIIGGKYKPSSAQLADLNADSTLALLKWFSSAQLFAFVSSPAFSNRRLRECAMRALKEIYAPFSLKASFDSRGTYFVYIADVRNGKVAVLKHPDLFKRSPLSAHLDKAEIHLTPRFGPGNAHVWLAVSQSITVSQLQLSFSCGNVGIPRGPSLRQLRPAFSSAQSLCVSAEGFSTCDSRADGVDDILDAILDAIGIGSSRRHVRFLTMVSRPEECFPVSLFIYFKLHLLFTFYLPRAASLESIDLRGLFITSRYHFEDRHAYELLVCSMLASLKTNRSLKRIQLRCHIEFISLLQEKLPEGCKITELNGEPVLSEEILKLMNCSPRTVVIVQDKQGMDEEKLYLHIDCTPPLPIH